MATLTTSFGRPQAGEYAPYYDRYICLISSGDLLAALETQAAETGALFRSADAKADFRYAPGKWSVKEVLGHINDTERIMAYRILRIARGDKTPIEGFEQDDYIRDGNFGQRTLDDLIAEFADIRRATLALVRSLDADSVARRGTANKLEISVRALVYVIAGHELHHRRIVQEKYLK
ncbi:MAG TPA: DinB family protein [Terriglobales bacterium]|nr:DinB family protein [Terriglobales bacterium]